ncbi:connector enhancer of kinase suppressor of ras 1 isoform X3 [Ovis aries]|uniref:connector enhancer of kinase suppressor of ras 1 isoform X3 n=1 Tax=Ovis aries TaxID=9940 RepID=UPI002952835E|nr:connector enhancer of kinase suppressor of ras 1 isoform X3 [Ovis aries]
MEPVATWTPRKVAAWLRGLDDSLQDYCFEDWELPGKYLLQLCPRSLEALTVWPLGHQEIILEGVEQLRALDCPAAEKESKVLRISSHVAGVCCNILSCCPEELLKQRAVLERVPLDDPAGLEIHTTSNCLHFVSQVGTQVPTESQLQVLPGDEIVQVNEQVVVGWPHKNVVRELLREPDRVSLVLKKVPVPETPRQTPPQPLSSPCPVNPSPAPASVSPRTPSKDIFDFDLPSNPSPGPSPPAWTDSTSLGPKPLPSPPATTATYPAEVAGTPEPPEHPDRSPVPGCRKSKGVATRRRVSCRELGPPDCDGWLLLRKVPGGFMGPRWRRCWFVLKGHTLYWYRQPQDEKAEGLINVSNYSLESGQDQKKKYVFQLTHNVYKPFIFAADTLTDLSMWVRHLITCISKYQSPGRASLPREEDCYSETEAEDPDDEAGSFSASPSQAQAKSSLYGDPSPAATPQGSPQTSFSPGTDSSEGALEGMVRGLRLGGVSLLGKQQPLTQEQWRSSFMRRNRDPQLNERVHRVRALQSTLKAKLQELQALEEVLGDPELTGEKFRRWKEQNQELYSEGLGAWGGEQAEGGSQVLNSDPKEQSSHPPPSDPEEHSPPCPLTPESDPRPPDL